MKEVILESCIKWKKEIISSHEAMYDISNTLFPKKVVSTSYLKKLIAFIYEIEEEELTGNSRKEETMIPKTLFRALLFEKYNSPSVVASKAGVKTHGAIINSINAHKRLTEWNKSYRNIYNSINTLLTEVI